MNTDALPLHAPAHRLIMVVDDNEASLYATSRMLRAGGFDVIEVANGSDALALAEQVALIVLDINLPDIDGFEVCRQLRARSSTAYLPILHLSATYTNPVDLNQGLAAGADSYLTHPVDGAVLVATVKALLFARQADVVKRHADARFRTVFELASSGIVLFDATLICRDVNPAFCTLVARERADIIDQPAANLIAPAGSQELAQLQAALGRDGYWGGTLPVMRPDGEPAYADWRIVSESGTGNLIAIAADATERRRAETERERLLAGEQAARTEAERSNRLKDEFLATLSHELRNPLNAILGWATVLNRTPGLPPAVAKGIEVIERNSRVQAHLIADLLDFAGIRFGKMRLTLEVVCPALVVQAAIDVVAAQARAKDLQIRSCIRNDESRVLADEARLQQVLWNLLSNSIKFTPAGGRIDIEAHADDGQYEVSVTDTGRGINPEFLPHIFDRFTQQESGASKRFAGLGIGLTIVKHLVDMHRGSIHVESRGENRGASFSVRLPLTQEIGSNGIAAIAPHLAGIQVLVVEDDSDARALIGRILTDAGARVAEAANADDAVAQIATGVPDVLLSDIGMPKRDGYQLLRTLRGAGYGAEQLPAIALTAFSRSEDRADALESGFQLHLTKPVNSDALISAVAELVRSRYR